MSTSTPSPVSAGSSSEGSALRAFVDEAIANDRHKQTQAAAMSPRSAVLSHTSLQGPQIGPASQSSADPPSAHVVADKRRKSRKRSEGDRRKRTTAPELSLSSLSRLDLDRLKKDPKTEALRLRELLEVAVRRAHDESKRASDLERANQDAVTKFRVLNENRLTAQQEAAKANAELRLHQLQLDNAQKEIERAQEALKDIERQRDAAEAEAARAREKARKLQQEKMIAAAKEEGRRLGYEAGFDHARKEREILAARRPSAAIGPPPRTSTSSKGKERAYPEDIRPRQSIRAPRRKPTDDDILSSPEASPSQLPLRNLSDYAQPGPSNYNPPRPLQPPTRTETPSEESEREPSPPPPQQQSRPESRPDPRSKTPSVQFWSVEVPSQGELDRSYNSLENENIPPRPQEEWVTANKHREIRGSPSQPPQFPNQQQRPTSQPIPNKAQFPNGQPPPLLPPRTNAYQRQTLPPPSKVVKFPKLSRPSLAKTKQQAASWYRTFSFRRKNKPIIDPIPEEMTPRSGGADELSEPQTASTRPPDSGASTEKMDGAAPQPPGSWYQSKQPSGPQSIKSRDYAQSRRTGRPMSDASGSTKMSQFDLLATPNIGLGQPAPPGKGVVREKESFLSVIREDSSRGNTPERPGTAGPSGRLSGSIPQPNFGGSRHSLQQQPSYETFDSNAQSKRRSSRRPPPAGIIVPDPDAPLAPAGVAYARHSQSQLGVNNYQGYGSNSNLGRRPSKISERSTPNTSIGIDVVPPSGFAPDAAQSPPHTGQNHLSPYHVFRPSQSVVSLRSQGGGAPPPGRPDSAAGHAQAQRQRSNQAMNNPYAEDRPPSTHSRVQSQSNNPYANPMDRPSSTHSRAQSQTNLNPYGNSSFHDISYHSNTNSPLQPPRPPFASGAGHRHSSSGSGAGRPESVRSGRSKRPPPRQASQSSFVVTNPDPPRESPPNGGLGGGTSQSNINLVLQPPIHRVTSSASMRSNASYSKYDPTGYVDPAYWGVDGPDGPPPQPLGGHRGSMSRLSVNSGLSYA